jgi:hypothetical protein
VTITKTSTTKVSSTTAAATLALTYEQVTAARIAVEAAHAAAVAAINAARDREAALRERLAAGDDTVSALDLAAAAGDVERHVLLAQGAAAAIVKAKAAEAPLMAEHFATILAEIVDPVALEHAQDNASAKIADALRELETITSGWTTTIREATAAATAAGIAHPDLSPFRIGLFPAVGAGFLGSPAVLAVDGSPLFAADLPEVVRDALVAGAKVAGFSLFGEGFDAVRAVREVVGD